MEHCENQNTYSIHLDNSFQSSTSPEQRHLRNPVTMGVF